MQRIAMPPTQRILVIDDEPNIGSLIADVAEVLGFSCTATTEASDFFEALDPNTGLVILDLMMPFIDGIELLRLLAEYKYHNGVVLMSGVETCVLETAEQLAAALGLSIIGRLRKPFSIAKLEGILRMYEDVPARVLPDTELVGILDEELRVAVQQSDFVLHYQPQIKIATHEVIGFEGLVRWLHPKLGVVYPDRFIERLEQLDLIDQLGWIVLKIGIENWHCLAEINGDAPTLSLNVAAHSLRDLTLPDRLALLLKQHNMPPAKLILEVTESGVLNHLANTLDVLTRLRLKGIQLAIDDFGIGYSMLQQLRRIPATELKIDKSFIHDMLTSHGDGVIVRNTIAIGHDLGMRLIAEGVETVEQLEYLSLHRCDIAQGYLIYKPQPLAVALSWFQQYRFSSQLSAPPFALQ
jgi:EAL domain-containing protein (putative c-di-GMP-specific phosphodiesterase class I)